MHAGALLVHHQRAARGLWADSVIGAEAVQVHVGALQCTSMGTEAAVPAGAGRARDHRQAPSRTPAITYMWLSLAACFYVRCFTHMSEWHLHC